MVKHEGSQMKILDGKSLATLIEQRVKAEIEIETSKRSEPPGLATILVGEDTASKVYVNIKQKACERVGIESKNIHLPKTIKEEQLISKIVNLNNDPSIHGILVQLPLPTHIDLNNIFSAINSKKDVDCFHPINFGNIVLGKEELVPATPKGIITLLNHYKIPIEGQDTVIVNHSNIVGKPLALMFLNRDATVSVAHIKTKDLKKIIKTAEILVVGVGNPKFIKKDMIQENVVIIDVGINRAEGKLVGDVDFDDVIDKVKAITPVPGGVGPMTVASLLENTLYTYKNLVS